MRPLPMWPILASLAACTPSDPAGGDATPPSFCDGPVGALYDPLVTDELHAWPDDVFTVVDDGSPTGLRVAVDPEDTPWVAALPDLVRSLFTAVDGLTGFARQGSVVLRFDAPVGEAMAGPHPTPSLDDPIVLLDLSTDPVTPVPWEGAFDDETRQLRMQPLRPLGSGTRHAAVVTDAFVPDAGGCISPSAVHRRLLDPTSTPEGPEELRLADRFEDLLERTGWRPDRIAHAIVFTTHDAAPTTRSLSDDLIAEGATWIERPSCPEPDGDAGRRSCTGIARVLDVRDADGAVRDGSDPEAWDIPVRIWMPPTSDAASPLSMFGHGLNGSAGGAGGRVADQMVDELGHVLFATDALMHGEHPSAGDDDLPALPFLGIDLSIPSIDGQRLRGNIVQTVLDRVQILDLMRRTPDLDGDGQDDFDPDAVGYWGVSLGGLLGPGVLALSDAVDAAVLSVGGGHLIKFALGSEQASFAEPLLLGLAGSPHALQRLLIVAQTAADPADPAMFAAHVLHDRLGEPSARPDVLLPVSIWDATVPPATGRALARAFPLPHIGPVFNEVPPLSLAEAPVSANVDGATAGYFQFDRVTDNGAVVASNHDNTPFREESYTQLRAFFLDWQETGSATIVDPYEELSTPPLPDDARP